MIPGISVGTMAAAATTGPARGPLPASSTPIIWRFDRDCKCFSSSSRVRGKQFGDSLVSSFWGVVLVFVLRLGALFFVVLLRFLSGLDLVVTLFCSSDPSLASAAAAIPLRRILLRNPLPAMAGGLVFVIVICCKEV